MSTANLQTQLADYKAGFITRVDPKRVAVMETATEQLRVTGIESSALKVGQRAPDVTLPNARGQDIALSALWIERPLIVVFYRGGWCPYCNLELRAWQEKLADVNAQGARIVAISPQTPDNSLSTAEKNALAFEVLSDSSLDAARGFGVAFDMPPELINLYASVGNDLPVLNGNGRWTLPVPATFVIDTNGIVQYAHVDVDYRNRAEPDDVLFHVPATDHHPA
jgi:peroxiredoxin